MKDKSFHFVITWIELWEKDKYQIVSNSNGIDMVPQKQTLRVEVAKVIRRTRRVLQTVMEG